MVINEKSIKSNGYTGRKVRIKRSESEEGVVLLEFIVIMPLYLALLGGVFWTSELALVHSQATMAGEYAAWMGGVRQRSFTANQIHDDLNGFYYKDENFGDGGSAAANRNSHIAKTLLENRWTGTLSSNERVNVSQWQLLYNLNIFLDIVQGNNKPRENMEISGGKHTVVMRVDNNDRDLSCANLCTSRFDVVRNTTTPLYLGENALGVLVQPSGAYERYSRYVTWSE